MWRFKKVLLNYASPPFDQSKQSKSSVACLGCEQLFVLWFEQLEQDDDFDKIYKGEISKSGAAILPSKRVRKIPEKINVSPKLEDEKKEEQTDQEPEEKITSDAEKKE